MKQYQLLQDYRGIPKDTMFFGEFPITGGGTGYFQKEDIPKTEEGGTNALFSSFVENSTLFQLIENQEND